MFALNRFPFRECSNRCLRGRRFRANIGETDNWYEIEFNGTTAYVSKDYISLTEPTPEVVKQTGYVYNLDGTLLNVRPQPSTSQAAIGTLSEGETVVNRSLRSRRLWANI